MRLSSIFAIAGTFVVAAALCLVAARFAVMVIEDASRAAVRNTLDENGMTWSEVDADGLQVYLAGTAPSEAKRFRALSIAGTVVDAARIIDQMLVEDISNIEPPRFSVEILRNDRGLSLIGLVPASMDREAFVSNIAQASGVADVADLLESADYPAPDTWDDAVRFAIRSLNSLPRTKISVDAGRVAVTAMTESQAAKAAVEAKLKRIVPDGVRLALDISAPRPVITPFTLRFLIEDGKARFDACSADTVEAQARILRVAKAAGAPQGSECTIGLGVPSPYWSRAAELAIAALAELGGGSVTFADADVSLLAPQGTPQADFDDIVGRLETSLPAVFSLHAVLPPPASDSAPAVPEFVATLSPEGLVQLRGQVPSAPIRDMVESFAQARFSSEAVHTTARVADNLPGDWTLRVLTGLETLHYLSNGAVTVTPDDLRITGATGQKEASAKIAGFLSEKLGDTADFSIDVVYQKALDPVASLPTPEECETQIAEVQIDGKINFEPGSANVDASGAAIMDEIAEILKKCGELRMEIGGHTDSQGREVMNQQLSQARAQTVLNELRMRRVLTASITAKGYGEASPIADNDSEDGREANRRIEFRVIRTEPVVERETMLESLEKPVEEAEGEATAEAEGADREGAESQAESEETTDEQN